MSTKEKAGLHSGHRERLRNKIRKFGLAGLEEHEQLEYMLYAYIPRKDTNPVAHELLLTFGSLHKVLDAKPEALASVRGMTENAALFLSSLPAFFTSYLQSEKLKRIENVQEVARYVMAEIGAKSEESFLMVCLDEKGYHIKTVSFSSEKKTAVHFEREKVVAAAVQCNAKIVVLAHNHPSGNLVPSESDIRSTNRIAQALQVVGIHLADHIIVADGEYYSMKAHGCMVEPVNLDHSPEKLAEDIFRWKEQVTELDL